MKRHLMTAAAALVGAFETREGDRETRQHSGKLEIKGVSDAGEFEGHGSVFNVEDSYGDIVVAGAFKRSLDEHRAAGTLPAMLWQHDSSQPIGVYTDMKEDGAGLYVKGQILLETRAGKEAHALLKAKAIRGLSIGFVERDSSYDKLTGIRTVKDVDLWEVSLVTFPANRSATVEQVKGANGITTERDLERFLRDAGMSKAEAVASVARLRKDILDRRDADGIKSALGAADRLLASLA